jgi:4-aminobutyrate aminotransferase / (S)-3-amino-2-methylpropionate transaminase / 5-aminovalerate transaminase
LAAGKKYIPELCNFFKQLPFPYPWVLDKEKISGKDFFKKHIKILLEENKINKEDITAFFLESYQGWGAIFYPEDYIQEMNKFAKENNSLIIFDEIQSGFGRTGKFFAYEYYNIEPDLVCIGKATTSSLPLSAVMGRESLIDVDPSFNSTHGGNPLACAAALANLEVFEKEKLVEQARHKEEIIEKEILTWQKEYPEIIKRYSVKGAVAAIYFFIEGTDEFNTNLVDKLIERSFEKGLMSVRTCCGTIKLGPPINIPDEAIVEGFQIMKESLKELL